MKQHLLLILGTTLTLFDVAGIARADAKPEPYYYGMPLDIRKVISMYEPKPNECKVITATMRYVDKAGDVKNMSYRKMSEACLFQN